MRRSVAAALFALSLSAAARAGEGVYITIDAGYGTWNKDGFRDRLNAQQLGVDAVSGVPNTELLLDRQMPDGGVGGLHLGYNIGGHVAFEVSGMLRPSDVLADTRSVTGLVGLAARWFPLQGLLKPSRQFDISLLAGVDYAFLSGSGVHGPVPNNPATSKIDNTGRGFDGTAVEVGLTAELYPAKWVSFGLTPRMFIVDPLRYFLNYDKADQGGAIPVAGSGGLKLYSLTLSVSFHFEPLPD
jgi:outer membrane protein with beta-barrel domain